MPTVQLSNLLGKIFATHWVSTKKSLDLYTFNSSDSFNPFEDKSHYVDIECWRSIIHRIIASLNLNKKKKIQFNLSFTALNILKNDMIVAV